MLGRPPGRGRIRQKVQGRVVRPDRLQLVRGRGVTIEAGRETLDVASRDEPVQRLPRTGGGIGAATQRGRFGRDGAEIPQAAMQQGRERPKRERFVRMAPLRPARGQQLGERGDGRRWQDDPMGYRRLGRRVGLVGRPLRTGIGCGGMETPLRRGPALGGPVGARGGDRCDKPGPPQGAGQRILSVGIPGSEQRAEPGPSGHLHEHRRAAGDKPGAAGGATPGLQHRIGHQAPAILRGRRAAPAWARARGAEACACARTKPDLQLRLPPAQQRQRQTGRPKRGRQGGGIPGHGDRHPAQQRIQRLGRADSRAPADVAERPCQGQPTIGPDIRHRCGGQQPQDPHLTAGHARSLGHASPPSPAALWASHARQPAGIANDYSILSEYYEKQSYRSASSG